MCLQMGIFIKDNSRMETGRGTENTHGPTKAFTKVSGWVIR